MVVTSRGRATAARVDPRIVVVGDSVILGARDAMLERLAGWQVTFDARESLSTVGAVDAIDAHRLELGAITVVALGNNDGASPQILSSPPRSRSAPARAALPDRSADRPSTRNVRQVAARLEEPVAGPALPRPRSLVDVIAIVAVALAPVALAVVAIPAVASGGIRARECTG